MTVLGIASLVILLLEFATRVIELFLVIRSALLTRRERSATSKPKPPKRSESRGELHAPCGSPLLYKTVHYSQEEFRADSRVALGCETVSLLASCRGCVTPVSGRSRTSI